MGDVGNGLLARQGSDTKGTEIFQLPMADHWAFMEDLWASSSVSVIKRAASLNNIDESLCWARPLRPADLAFPSAAASPPGFPGVPGAYNTGVLAAGVNTFTFTSLVGKAFMILGVYDGDPSPQAQEIDFNVQGVQSPTLPLWPALSDRARQMYLTAPVQVMKPNLSLSIRVIAGAAKAAPGDSPFHILGVIAEPKPGS